MENIHIKIRLSKLEKYPAKDHLRRVACKLGAKGLIYLSGQSALNIEDSDQPKTWHQRRYFYYCSGVDVPNCCLTYDLKADLLVLYVPEIHPERVVWQGRGPTVEEAEEQYDIDAARTDVWLFSYLRSWQQENPDSPVFILHKDQRPDVKLKLPRLDAEKLQPAIEKCRAIKDHYEIQRIKRANQISDSAHRAVLANLSRFSDEAQIQGVFEGTCISQLAKKQAYAPIVGSGENASVLHYTQNDEPLKGRQLICMDAGAEFENYASDVTRTFPISGHWPSSEARSIYRVVEEMQEHCIGRLKPGVKMLDLHQAATRIAIEGLLGLGVLCNGTVEEIFEAGTCKGFYPHGLGHHLGLDVHDVPGVPILRYSNELQGAHQASHTHPTLLACAPEQPPLEAGMVVTVEPGIYFNRFELERAYLHDPMHSKYIDKTILEKYWAVGGVRIEDDLVITASGYENLSTAPKVEEAMKIIRQGTDCF